MVSGWVDARHQLTTLAVGEGSSNVSGGGFGLGGRSPCFTHSCLSGRPVFVMVWHARVWQFMCAGRWYVVLVLGCLVGVSDQSLCVWVVGSFAVHHRPSRPSLS